MKKNRSLHSSFERRDTPLLPLKLFRRRLLRHGLISLILIFLALSIGVCGYHYLETMTWLDALLNASMILGGMGPVDILKTDAGKLFASAYALFSGVAFLVIVGVLLAPAVHRIMHRFHLEADDD